MFKVQHKITLSKNSPFKRAPSLSYDIMNNNNHISWARSKFYNNFISVKNALFLDKITPQIKVCNNIPDFKTQ